MLVTIAEHRYLDKSGNEVIEYGVMEGADLRQVDQSGVGIRVCKTSEVVFEILENLRKEYHKDIQKKKEFNKISGEIWRLYAATLQMELFPKM